MLPWYYILVCILINKQTNVLTSFPLPGTYNRLTLFLSTITLMLVNVTIVYILVYPLPSYFIRAVDYEKSCLCMYVPLVVVLHGQVQMLLLMSSYSFTHAYSHQ